MTNHKHTKRALLSSMVSLVLCFAMLLGTTFAWFTDTASTSVNKIQAGTLKVALLDKNGESLEGKTLDFVKAEGHENEAILWEPGATYDLQPITIKNEGNLALKYQIMITGIDGDAKLNEVIEWSADTTGNQVNVDNVDDSFGVSAGAFTDTISAEYYLLPNTECTLKISGHMKKTAGNEYQGLSIDDVAITVYATQYAYEYDSINNTYDATATLPDVWDGTISAPSKTGEVYHITSAAEFAWLMSETQDANSPYAGETFVLDCDISFAGKEITGVGSDQCNISFTFDGNGHTISDFTINRESTHYAGLFQQLNGTVKNLTVKDAVITGKKQVGAVVSSNYGGTVENCHAINCILIGTEKVGAVVGYSDASVTNCSASDCSVYASVEEAGEVVGYNGGTVSGLSHNNVAVVIGGTYVANGVAQQDDTYLISNADGMFWFAEQVANNNYYFNNKTVKLIADIDLANRAWTPVGTCAVPFAGTFDGNGHTIKNLNVTEAANVAQYDGVGLFGWVGIQGGATGYVKNVTIDGASVAGSRYVGAVAGYLQFGSIDNCTVKNATVTGTHKDQNRCGDKVGAVIGMVAPNGTGSTVSNCKAENCEVKAARDAGQVIGMAYTSQNSISELSATKVTVSATTGCTDEDAGSNINAAVVGREG